MSMIDLNFIYVLKKLKYIFNYNVYVLIIMYMY